MTLSSSLSKPFKIVALLPMKANSNRVKGKNFRDLGGKPLFRWILDTLLSVDLIDQVVINTDAHELLKINGLPEDKRILVRQRKDHICGDNVSMNLVIEDDIKNVDADLFLMTHTTNPFLQKETVIKSIHHYRTQKIAHSIDSLFTVNKHQTRFYGKDAVPINHDPKKLIPTQDLEPWYEENSNLYIFTRESFKNTNARIGKYPIMLETNKVESIDIDTPEDWELASMVASSQLLKSTNEKDINFGCIPG